MHTHKFTFTYTCTHTFTHTQTRAQGTPRSAKAFLSPYRRIVRIWIFYVDEYIPKKLEERGER